MKSSNFDIAKFYLQVTLIKVMYYNFFSYLVALVLVALLAPIVALITYAWSVELGYWKQLKPFYRHLINSANRDRYYFNKGRLVREIEEKRKEL